MKYAKILFPQKVGQNEDILTYSIPEHLPCHKGQAVLAPIRNRAKSGLILEICEKKPDFKTRDILEILEEKPLLNDQQLILLSWISSHYFCPLHKALKLFLPKRVLERRASKRQPAEKENKIKQIPEKKLTPEQTKAFKTILDSSEKSFLLQGITGSGKTEIYARLAKHYLSQQKQVLLLLPEISLTPQMIEYFEKNIGISAAIINSKLSEVKRYQTWEKIWKNETKLIIGSRSAIFAPFQNLGLIILDEEHEYSYKQDNSPRYFTHKVAEKIQDLSPQTKIVFGSATPSVETKEKLEKTTIYLNSRIGDSTLPEIEIVDLRDEFKKKNNSIFSDRLREELTKVLAKNEQAILFLNRRGSASSIVCRDCGYTESCKDCETPLTFHSKTLEKPSLICHHCGKISTPPSSCPNCSGVNIRYLGVGTQKIEQDLLKEFPGVKVLRADKDTTSQKDGFKKIYQDFKKHKADVLIGTQMIAKGLHLPKVSLVGVILADIGLNIPDFRTAERNFQLMTQVAGRAGRSKIKGKVIIQSYNPENTSLIFTQKNDYQEFFNYERNQRKLLANPPFSELIKIVIEESSEKNAREKAEKIEDTLWSFARKLEVTKELEINTFPAYLFRLRKKYRYIVLIKMLPGQLAIQTLLENLPKEYIIDPTVKIDIDPITTS